MEFFDTHCHIHEPSYTLPVNEVIAQAAEADVRHMVCVGTTVETSKQAIAFATEHTHCWASVGLHPHDAKLGQQTFKALATLLPCKKVVAIGECGLDYFYNHSDKKDQEKALRFQIELALEHNLPLIFHVREAFDDFWPVFDSYSGLRGVLHSFTDTRQNADKALARGLYIGINGIMTFTKSTWQLEVAKAIPLKNVLLETDAPFLTPAPFRGKVNMPAYVRVVAEFLAELREEHVAIIAAATTQNARRLFLNKHFKNKVKLPKSDKALL